MFKLLTSALVIQNVFAYKPSSSSWIRAKNIRLATEENVELEGVGWVGEGWEGDTFDVELKRPLGLVIERVDELIAIVDVKGNAEAAGVKIGDELVSVLT